MKRLPAILFATVLLFTLTACRTHTYTDATTGEALALVALEGLPNESGYTAADQDALQDYFEMPDFVRDYRVYFSADRNNLDEIGIFHVMEGHAKEMQALLRTYLAQSLEDHRAWYDSYIPQETPKLRDAEVRIFGNYAVYAILSDDAKTMFFDAVERALKV